MNLDEAIQRNAIVKSILDGGGALSTAVCALVEAYEALTQEMIMLEHIVPRKMVVGNKAYIWRCPAELIPETHIDSTPQDSRNELTSNPEQLPR